MKTIKAVYNEETTFILDVVSKFQDKAFVETYDLSYRKERKKGRVLQEDYGTKNLPLIVLEDENMEGYAAIWPENDPNWEEEIIKYLKYI